MGELTVFWMTLTGTLNSHTSAHETFTRLLAVLETLIDQYVPRAKQDDRGNKMPWKTNPPSSLKRRRKAAWEEYKSLRYKYGRKAPNTVSALMVFLQVNPPPPGLFLYPPQPGGSDTTPPLLSRKRMDVERRTRRRSKDLDETLPNHLRKLKIEVTCQVKVRSKVKIECFQVADRSFFLNFRNLVRTF